MFEVVLVEVLVVVLVVLVVWRSLSVVHSVPSSVFTYFDSTARCLTKAHAKEVFWDEVILDLNFAVRTTVWPPLSG